MRGQTIGVVGLGDDISQTVNVCLLDSIFPDGKTKLGSFREHSLQELLFHRDGVFLHGNWNDSVIKESSISEIKPGALLINTSHRHLLDDRCCGTSSEKSID